MVMFASFGIVFIFACGIGNHDTGHTQGQIQPMDTLKTELDDDMDQDENTGTPENGEGMDWGEPEPPPPEPEPEPEPEPPPPEPDVPPPEPEDTTPSNSPPTWSNDILPIMEEHCDSCHIGWSATLYEDVVDAPVTQSPNPTTEVRVLPYLSGGSYLFKKLQGTHQAGEAMPLDMPPLDPSDLDVIMVWISDGAVP